MMGRPGFGGLVTLLAVVMLPGALRAAVPPAGPETVVLLHGLGRTPRSMNRMERALGERGYRVVNLAYPSRERTIEELSRDLHERILECCAEQSGPVHFVTHSMGGILVRQYLHDHDLPNAGRVVMLSPPNGGSELVDLLERLPVVRRHVGPSREQLGTGPEDLPSRLGPVRFELGVIAGRRSWNPLFSSVLPGADDGMVSVARARVEGMSDFLVVPRAHPFIMRDRAVIEQSVAFLRRGAFDHTAQAGAAHE